jgi:Flp pilus assembly protein TadG
MVMPLVMMLLFGGIEVGRLLTDFHAVNKSLRNATRYLSHVGITCPSAGPSTGPLANYIVTAANETIANNLAMTGSVATPAVPGDYLLTYWTNAATISTTIDCIANGGQYLGLYDGVPYIPRITMTAAVPFNFIWGSGFVGPAGVTITIRHNEVHVGIE